MRGRKRRLVPRQPNGQPTRRKAFAAPAEAADGVAIAARVRIYHCDLKAASGFLMGSVIGRLVVAGDLTPEQLYAAQRYLEVRDRYLRSLDVPEMPRKPREEGQGGCGCQCEIGCYDIDSPGCRAAQSRAAAEAWSAVTSLLAALMIATRDPSIVDSMRVIVERDGWVGHMLPSLRKALNALDKHFREGQRRAA